MLRAQQIVLASLLALSLAACATQAPDLTPPPAKPLDAKSTLEGSPRR
jgi:predicted small lipoprotein YifL